MVPAMCLQLSLFKPVLSQNVQYGEFLHCEKMYKYYSFVLVFI